ncbi:MAG: SusC/RagA family TonB-linked outer membrane protein [Bacteroidia bacterium]|nr:SusC/RagA family TonB-linked outer membrane protein [Bacteroidia bacterium]
MKKSMKHKFQYLLFFLLSLPAFIYASGQEVHVNLNFKSTPLRTVLTEIGKQSSYSMVYNTSDVDPNRLVTIKSSGEKIEAVMNRLLKGTGISYAVMDGHIILSVKKNQEPQQKSRFKLAGSVADVKGEPLIGVSVSIKGTNSGGITDLDGKFSVQAAKGDILEISYVGYAKQSITVADAKALSIVLKEDTEVLDEVVVTALGIKRAQKALSYNVQEIKGDELTVVKDANFINSLQGKVAGVQINASSGGIGSASRVVMRGSKSITKDNNALYVIDGIPMFNVSFGKSEGAFATQSGSDGVADINPDDIESINMLTGPSAAALYGSDAANGVVLINTKKGTKEKTSLTYTNNTMFSTPYIMPKMQNRYGNHSGELASWGNPTDKRFDSKGFFNTGTNVINSVSFSTGTSRNQTYASASATNANGILPNNSYNRYNFSIRNTANFLNDKLTIDLGATYVVQDDKNITAQGQYYNPLPALYLFPRNENFEEVQMFERYSPSRDIYTQFWPYGDNGLSLQNPYWIMKRMKRETEKKRYTINGSLTYKIADWINIGGRVKVDNSDFRFTQKRYASTLTNFAGENGYYSDINRTDRHIYADAMVNIDKRMGDFSLSANIGTSFTDLQYEEAGGAGDLAGIANFFTLRNINYENNYKPKQFGYHDQTQSVFANVELGWKSMVYLTVTGRNDWVSALAFTDNNSFFYPSVGTSLVLTEMFKLPELISYAKLRASYSSVGTSFERYLSNPGYEFVEQSHQWASSTKMPATDLKPEDTRSWELGLNVKLWRNFNVDLTYYRSNTYNQTFTITLPSSSGFSSGTIQTGNIQNEGVELALGYQKKWGDFGWNSNLTYTLNRNKVKRLAGGAKNPLTGEPIEMDEMRVQTLGFDGFGPRVILKEGGTMSDIYVDKGLKTDGNGAIWVDSQSGKLAVETYDKPKKVGSMSPKYNVGFSNDFSYKGLNLGVVLMARVGGLVVSNTQGVLDYYGVSEESAAARDRGGVWINNGFVDAKTYYQTVGGSTGGLGQYYLYSATNVRLQELSLSYTLPRQWFKDKMGLTVGLVGKNLWMIYCKAPFDPEMTPSTVSNFYQGVDYFMQPSTRNIGFNVKLSF